MKQAKPEVDISALAQALKISYQAVRKVLRGGRFGMKNNAAAAMLLGVNSDWLATGKGPRLAPPLEANAASRAPDRYRLLHPQERELLENFHDMLEDDQSEFAAEIASRAAKIRAHNARVLGRPPEAASTDAPPVGDAHRVEQSTTQDKARMRALRTTLAKKDRPGVSAKPRSKVHPPRE